MKSKGMIWSHKELMVGLADKEVISVVKASSFRRTILLEYCLLDLLRCSKNIWLLRNAVGFIGTKSHFCEIFIFRIEQVVWSPKIYGC